MEDFIQEHPDRQKNKWEFTAGTGCRPEDRKLLKGNPRGMGILAKPT